VGELRVQRRTELLSEIYELGHLWEHYGIVGDIAVSIESSSAKSHSLFHQPFTRDMPRADIHELIAPDILHQIIKGVFKDHLVTWVECYLTNVHGARRAKAILDEIDRRSVLLLCDLPMLN
jgi:Plavaka transposase